MEETNPYNDILAEGMQVDFRSLLTILKIYVKPVEMKSVKQSFLQAEEPQLCQSFLLRELFLRIL